MFYDDYGDIEIDIMTLFFIFKACFSMGNCRDSRGSYWYFFCGISTSVGPYISSTSCVTLVSSPSCYFVPPRYWLAARESIDPIFLFFATVPGYSAPLGLFIVDIFLECSAGMWADAVAALFPTVMSTNARSIMCQTSLYVQDQGMLEVGYFYRSDRFRIWLICV